MIEFVSGDFFEFDADIMINTVNCVGVMGAGVALAFKKRFPEMFDDYVKKCRAGTIRPGSPSVWIQKDMISKEVEIINFPTKDNWKNPSEYQYIDDGLEWLSAYLEDKNEKVVTLPALGCGHGGLDWSRVRSMISDRLQSSPARIYVFEPADSLKVDHINERYSDYESLLSSLGGGVVRFDSDEYPKNLSTYTKKELYYYPKEQKNFVYDYSIICSSRPEQEEIDAVRKFIDFCIIEKRSVLLGGTAFEKKIAFELSAMGLVCGCVLPSGIYASVRKLSSTKQRGMINLLSIGNPIVDFDKKEFVPSVLARMYLSKRVIFFTSKLVWLRKFKNQFKRASIDTYYYASQNSSAADMAAILDIGATEFDLDVQRRSAGVKS
nr:macro domain-containing protein [uncultured Undibacterium sp.]